MGPLGWACKRSSVPLLLVDVQTVCLHASCWRSGCTSCCNVLQIIGYLLRPDPTPRSALACKDGAATMKRNWFKYRCLESFSLSKFPFLYSPLAFIVSLFHIFLLTNYVSSSSLSRQEWTPEAPSMQTSRMTPGLSPAVIHICSCLLALKNHLTAASAIKGHSLATFRLFNLAYVYASICINYQGARTSKTPNILT